MQFINNCRFWLIGGTFLIFLPTLLFAQNVDNEQFAIDKTKRIIHGIIAISYPELDVRQIKVKAFQSQDTFFKAQFSIVKFLTSQKMQTTIFVNPKVFEMNAPEEGIRSILAHELAHAVYYKTRGRLQLFGLVRLINGSFTAKFERNADLVAIEKGYGAGLIEYRVWLFQKIPEKQLLVKKRNYFTPEELKVLLLAFGKDPAIVKKLKQDVPRNLYELNIKINP